MKKFLLVLAVAVLSLTLAAGCSVTNNGATVNDDGAVAHDQDKAVFVGDDGLYFTYLGIGERHKVASGTNIEYPLISADGMYVAYTSEKNLYLVPLQEMESEPKLLVENVLDYAWGETVLFYSSDATPGLSSYNVSNDSQSKLIDDQYFYNHIVTADGQTLYMQKWEYWQKDEQQYASNTGIIAYDVAKGTPTMLVEGRRSTEQEIGYNPTPAKLSADGNWLYIWQKPSSGSLSSDGVVLGVYDLAKQKFISGGEDYLDPAASQTMGGLAYNDNLTVDPTGQSTQAAFISGGMREMTVNKTLMLWDTSSSAKTALSPTDMVAMTPSFALDGNSVLYSATPAATDDKTDDFEAWLAARHAIYRATIQSGEVVQVSQNNAGDGDVSFDFGPQELSNGQIVFLRLGGDSASLFVTDGQEDSLLVDGVRVDTMDSNNFYGHYDIAQFIDFYIK